MRVRTLRMKDGFKEFAMINDIGKFYTSATPQLINNMATRETLKLFKETFYSDSEIDFDQVEIVEFEMTEIGVIE
jgi:hypothetical protein